MLQPNTTTAEAQLAGKREWIGLAALMLVVLAVAIDNTVLSFAIPHISADLAPSATMQLWLIDSYPLVLAALLVPMGNLGDRIGRRKLLLIGTAGFTVFSVLAAFAPTAPLLLACRIALGVFGATLMPCTLSLLRSMFPVRAQRRFAIAVWSLGFAVGGALGPVLGGFLLDSFHWGSIFLMHLPMTIPLLFLAPLLIDESRDPDPGPFDLPSVLLSALTITPIAFGIKHMAAHGFDLLGVAGFVVGIGAGWLLVRRLRRSRNPLLDVRLFAYPAFSGSVLINMLSCMAIVGLIFFLSQHVQLVEGLSALHAGLTLVPGTAIMVVATFASVWLAKRFPLRWIIASGLTAALITYVCFALFGAQLPVVGLAILFAALSAGVGIAETLSADIIMTSVPPSKAGAASAISETSYELGTVIGTSVLGGILTASYRSHLDLPADLAPELVRRAEATLADALNVAEELGGELGATVAEHAKHAFDSGVIITSGIAAILVAGALVLAVTTLRDADEEPTA